MQVPIFIFRVVPLIFKWNLRVVIMKFKDIVNQKINSRNHQVSFDLQKRKANEAGINIEDLMEMDISKSQLKKFKRGDF